VRHCLLHGGRDRIGQGRQAVVNPEPVPPSRDEARAPQIGEMARRLRLGNVEAAVDMADADFTGRKETENAKPRSVGESLEERFELREL
jgi:hypothetical protein